MAPLREDHVNRRPADPLILPADATRLVKRSVMVAGHKTSISLEDVFWAALKRAAERRALTVTELVTAIDAGRTGNLSSALRVFLLLEAGSPVDSTPKS